MMTKSQVLEILRDVDSLPFGNGRTIYEWGQGPQLKGSGRFGIDFAAYGSGSAEEVPFSVISELLAEGLIVPAYRDSPNCHAWILAPKEAA
jgi:hypothetical protein